MDARPGDIAHPWTDPPDEVGAVEVAEGLLWMRLPMAPPLRHVNVYALDEGDGWTLIDTGLGLKPSFDRWEALLAGPLAGRPVTRVVLTHHHPDHVGCAGWFAAKGAEILASRTAWLMARMLTLDVQDRPMKEQIAFWRGAGMPEDLLDERATTRPFNFADVVTPIPLGFTRLQDGETLRAGGRDWAIRFGQGHAPDHVTLWTDDIVIAGDQILPGISPNLGVYPTEPLADPVGEWLTACERLAGIATERHLALPGHRLPFTGIPARLGQLIDNHHGALQRLCDHLATPHTAHECFAPLYKREIGAGEYGLALVEAVGHLNHLHRRGQITRSQDSFGAWRYQTAGQSS